MANTFNNNLYLESAGLQVLIKKLAGVEKSNQEAHSDLSTKIGDLGTDLTNLIEFLNATVVNTESEEGQIEYAGEVKRVIELADAIRAELGAAPEEITETVYEKLTDLTTRLKAIEDKNLDTLIDTAFCDVDEPVYDANAQNVTIQFRNRAGEPVKTAVIDTKDFVVHGLMDGVDVVSYNGQDEQVTIGQGDGAITLDVPFEVKAHAGKYIVFRFKLAHEHDDMENSAHGEMKAVWVNVNDLFTDYEFEGAVAEGSEDYIEIEAIETAPSYTEANHVTIKVGVGSKQKYVNDLVEGNIQDPDENVGKNYRGVEDLNKGLKTVEKTINDDLQPRVDALETNDTKQDGRLDDLETNDEIQDGRLDDIENWASEDHSIPVEFVKDYFDFHVLKTYPNEPDITDGKYNQD